MAVPVAALAKIAAAALSDEDTRKRLGWIVAAICSPLILTLALICSLLSGSAEHNNSAVLLCFNGGNIPGKTPAEYVAYIEDMRRSFTLLDDAITAVNDMTENSDSLNGICVKAVFYAIFFGEDTPSRRAHRQFTDCFVAYEERTRTVTDEDGTETEESYTVAIPIADIAAVYGNLENVLHLEISAEQKSNADSIYSLVRYGIAGGTEGWIPGADVPYIGADGLGYLGTEDNTAYISQAILTAIQGTLDDNNNRLRTILFKCAVELNIKGRKPPVLSLASSTTIFLSGHRLGLQKAKRLPPKPKRKPSIC